MTDVLRPVFNDMRNGSFRVSLGGMNPTGASCWIKDEKGNDKLVGKCRRQVWYSKTKVPRTNLPNDETFIKFAVGHAMEENFQEHWQRQGVMLDGNVKVRQDISNGDPRGELIVSGEIDVLLRDFDLDLSSLKNEPNVLLLYKQMFAAKNDIYRKSQFLGIKPENLVLPGRLFRAYST